MSNALVDDARAEEYRGRWQQIQIDFVDQPRHAVAEADGLVSDIVQQLVDSFADERRGLESRWDRGEEISTEDLRVTLQRYRDFFDRLLNL